MIKLHPLSLSLSLLSLMQTVYLSPGSPPRPKASNELVFLRGRFNALHSPHAMAFLTASFSITAFIRSSVWSVVVQRYLGLPVYDGSLDDLQCQHCAAGGHETTLNRLGDRALVCRNVYGSTARLNALTSVLFAMSYCLLVIHLLVRCVC